MSNPPQANEHKSIFPFAFLPFHLPKEWLFFSSLSLPLSPSLPLPSTPSLPLPIFLFLSPVFLLPLLLLSSSLPPSLRCSLARRPGTARVCVYKRLLCELGANWLVRVVNILLASPLIRN